MISVLILYNNVDRYGVVCSIMIYNAATEIECETDIELTKAYLMCIATDSG